MKFGFALRRLALIGPGKAPAEVTFARGLNVIAGPSDSGKSFIAQCLDYALGSGTAPKEIPEAEGYSAVVLCIASSDCSLALGRSTVDLHTALRTQFAAAGVPYPSIHSAPWCTRCRTDLFFSFRAEGPAAGRLMAVIGPSAGP